MRHIRLVVEYDGSTLCGWQRQINGPTVQGHLEDALGKLLGTPTPVVGASRTDAGVHARGQVASFRTARTIPVHGIRRAINTMLPRCIAIRDATEVDEAFHPRFSASGKHYRYTVFTRPDRSPFFHDRAWHHPRPAIDPDRIRAAAPLLVGQHDFAAFRAVACDARTTIRKITAVEVSTPAPDVLVLEVYGNAFLRNMVRIIAGTLVEVGTGAREPAQLTEIIASRDRTQAGITAPAHGLELVTVFYDGARVSSGSSKR
ncbi:MAG: tRNA pseudouridine(38-40) synthase TruA [Proteobacteria bacterium]|nr:tRNA pseudouridine(38-40) synthase TruA [Pseudomonadota bacterium]